MIFGQESNQSKHNFCLFLLCLLYTINLINCQQATEYKYTFYLDEAIAQDLSQTLGIKIYNQNLTGQVLDEFIIKQPKQLDTVVQIITTVNTQGLGNDTIKAEIDPNEVLSAPDIDKLWIDAYTWPIKKDSLLYSLSLSDKSAAVNYQTTIVSAAYIPSTPQQTVQKIINDDLQIYVLLSTGQIRLVEKNHEQLVTEKTYSYNYLQGGNSEQMQWEDGQLYYKHGALTLLVSQSFYFIGLNQITTTNRQTRLFYDLIKLPGLSTVLKVIQTSQLLLIFTNKACFKLSSRSNQPQMVMSYYQIMREALGVNDEGFLQRVVDFAVGDDGNGVYLLHEQLGVIVYNVSSKEVKLLRVQHPQLAERIDVHKEMVMVTYEIAEEQYVQEYHFVREKGQFVVNKIYAYHSEQAVGNILLFDREMIISRGSQILHGLHSLSRNLPYAFHKQSQVLQSKSHTSQITQLRPIWSHAYRLPGYMIITETSLELIEFQPHSQGDIQEKWVSITSKTSGTLSFDIQFIGTCRNSTFYPPEYCSLTKSVKLTINDRVSEQITLWWLWILIAVGCYLILCALFVIFYAYFSRKQNQFESLIESQRQRKRNSTVVEMSFDTGTMPTEPDEK